MKFKSILLLSIAFAYSSIKCAAQDDPKPTKLENDTAKCLYLLILQDKAKKDLEDSGKLSEEHKKAVEAAAKSNDLTEGQETFVSAATPKTFAHRSRSPLITDEMKDKAKYWEPFLKRLGDGARCLGSYEEFVKNENIDSTEKAAILQDFCDYVKSIGASPAFVAIGSPTFAGCPSPLNLPTS